MCLKIVRAVDIFLILMYADFVCLLKEKLQQ